MVDIPTATLLMHSWLAATNEIGFYTCPKSELASSRTFGVSWPNDCQPNLPEGKRTQWALTREQMRDCVGFGLSWSVNSSLPNGHLTRIYATPGFAV